MQNVSDTIVWLLSVMYRATLTLVDQQCLYAAVYSAMRAGPVEAVLTSR